MGTDHVFLESGVVLLQLKRGLSPRNHVQFQRSDTGSARPDSIVVKYTIDGEAKTKRFLNQKGG